MSGNKQFVVTMFDKDKAKGRAIPFGDKVEDVTGDALVDLLVSLQQGTTEFIEISWEEVPNE